MYDLNRWDHLTLTMLAGVRYGEQTRVAGIWWKPALNDGAFSGPEWLFLAAKSQ